jgi:hypothetical protein
MHGVARAQELVDPRHKLKGLHPARWLGQRVIVLRHRHVEPGMHTPILMIEPESLTLPTATSSEAAPS